MSHRLKMEAMEQAFAMEGKSKQESASPSSSSDKYASQFTISDQEPPCYRITDFCIGKASAPSGHKEETIVSCFYNPLNPHKLFLQFVNFIAFDHLVIADFLLSPETFFLAYFTKYISLLNDEWKLFYESCQIKESVKNEKNIIHFNVKSSISLPQFNNDNSKTIIEKTKSYCYSLPVLNKSPICSPPVLSKHSKIQQTFSSNSMGKKDTALEPPDKKTRLKSRPETEDKLPFCMNVSVTDLESADKKLTSISSLVSYTDSENSENEVSDHEEIVIGKAGNECLTPQCLAPFETSKQTNGVRSENITTNYNLTVPDDSAKSNSHSNLSYHGSSQYSTCNDNESEQDSNEEAEEDYESNSNILDQFMTMLIRLHFHIERLNERSLIPYNVNHLLKLLNLCIEKYECHENESF